MGLTGVVVAATLRLRRVETTWVEVDTERFDDLDDAMSAMQTTDHLYRYRWRGWTAIPTTGSRSIRHDGVTMPRPMPSTPAAR